MDRVSHRARPDATPVATTPAATTPAAATPGAATPGAATSAVATPGAPAAGVTPDRSMLDVSVSVVAPVHNEVGNLPALLDELSCLPDRFASFQVVVVDDGSTDGSAELLDAYAETRRWLHVTHLPANRGQTMAVALGVAAARGELVVLMDSDGQNDPADIPRLVAHQLLTGADIVAGFRQHRKEPPHRRLLSAAGNRLCREVSGVEIRDSGCSLKVFRSSVLRTLRLRSDDHRFLPAWAAYRGARVAELAVNDRARRSGCSHYGLARVPRVLIDLFGMWVSYRFRDRPLRSAVWAASRLTVLWAATTALLTGSGQFGLALFAGITGVTILGAGLLVGAIAEAQLRDRSYHELGLAVDAAVRGTEVGGHDR